MLSIDFNTNEGWSKPKIMPYGPIDVETTSTSLHYGITAFEGMSCAKNEKTGELQFFKMDQHLDSFYRSSDHLQLPTFDHNELKKLIQELVRLDKDWYPETHFDDQNIRQMYIRLCHFS